MINPKIAIWDTSNILYINANRLDKVTTSIPTAYQVPIQAIQAAATPNSFGEAAAFYL